MGMETPDVEKDLNSWARHECIRAANVQEELDISRDIWDGFGLAVRFEASYQRHESMFGVPKMVLSRLRVRNLRRSVFVVSNRWNGQERGVSRWE
jgi:hypothetical protein